MPTWKRFSFFVPLFHFGFWYTPLYYDVWISLKQCPLFHILLEIFCFENCEESGIFCIFLTYNSLIDNTKLTRQKKQQHISCSCRCSCTFWILYTVISKVSSDKHTMDRTLWVWQSLPKVVEENPDKSWIKEGDAVENAQRLAMGNIFIFFVLCNNLE